MFSNLLEKIKNRIYSRKCKIREISHYEIAKLRVQQFGLTATIKDDSGDEHYFYRGHEYVEIGGRKWAVTNVGAEKETDGGLYFAFGETKGYTAKQINSGERKFIENEYANANFDSVKAYWGGKWRMPTAEEFYVLISATTNRWVDDYQGSGVSGRLFTDITDRSKKLFFPAVGACDYGNVYIVGCFGYYWSSSLLANDVTIGRSLRFDDMFCGISEYNCYFGFSVRGVVGN